VPVQTQLRAVDGPIRDAAIAAEAIAVPFRPGPEIDPAYAGELAGLFALGAADLLAHQEAKGEPGEVVGAPFRMGDGITELLLFAVGDASPPAMRRAGAALGRRVRGRSDITVGAPSGLGEEAAAAFAEGLLMASYDFRIGGPARRPGAETINIIIDAGTALERGGAVARAVALARDLANTPSLGKTPQWLAEQAEALCGESGLTARIRDEHTLREEGFGGLVAVGSGSARPPRLIELTYEPNGAADGDRHIVLVGKGITFDSGGLSLKPNEGMKHMKTDMAAGAAVIAVMSALRALNIPVKVTGLIAAAENMPSGSAMRPGDVVRHYGGMTSEVLNTDAEGRIVLADALAYAHAELNPTTVVDLATLTGAARIALGSLFGALYSGDDSLAEELISAGQAAGDGLWRMPLVEDYREAIDSDIADVANMGRGGYGGGSITAALFLREFAGGRRWAHLDIAGPARSLVDDGEISKGATGFGVRLLLKWLGAA
jgi:leucyl aminopeptidase